MLDRVHESAAVTVSPPLPAPAARDLPGWQLRIVALVSRGIPIRQAAESQNVSWASCDRYLRDSVAFYDAVTNAEAGTLITGLDTVRALAVAHAKDLVLDAVSESRGLDATTGKVPVANVYNVDGTLVGTREIPIRGADRLGNRRLVLETAGAIGQGAQVSVAIQFTASQVAILVQQLDAQQLTALVSPAPALPAPTAPTHEARP